MLQHLQRCATIDYSNNDAISLTVESIGLISIFDRLLNRDRYEYVTQIDDFIDIFY